MVKEIKMITITWADALHVALFFLGVAIALFLIFMSVFLLSSLVEYVKIKYAESMLSKEELLTIKREKTLERILRKIDNINAINAHKKRQMIWLFGTDNIDEIIRDYEKSKN